MLNYMHLDVLQPGIKHKTIRHNQLDRFIVCQVRQKQLSELFENTKEISVDYIYTSRAQGHFKFYQAAPNFTNS